MKLLLFADLHLSFKNLSFAIEALKRVFEIAQEKKINHIISLGDLFHNRAYVHVDTIKEFCGVLDKYYITKNKANSFYNITGNHDRFDKKASFINAIKNVICIDEPSKFILDSNKHIFMIPYNFKDVEIPQGTRVVLGHLELDTEYANVKGDFPTEKLKHIPLVLLGHIHKAGIIKPYKNIQYLGSAFRQSFADEKSLPKCIILDTETLALEEFELPSPTYQTINFGEQAKEDVDFVRVQITNALEAKKAKKAHPKAKIQIVSTLSTSPIFDTEKIDKVDSILAKFIENNSDLSNTLDQKRLLELGVELCQK